MTTTVIVWYAATQQGPGQRPPWLSALVCNESPSGVQGNAKTDNTHN